MGDHTLPPSVKTDLQLLHRLAEFSKAEFEHGLKLSTLYVNAEYIAPGLWAAELETIQALTRVLKAYLPISSCES